MNNENQVTKRTGPVLFTLVTDQLNHISFFITHGNKQYQITSTEYDKLSEKSKSFSETPMTEEERLKTACILKFKNKAYKILTYEELENGYDLKNAILKHADLSNLDLSKCELENADLSYCDFSGSTLPENLKNVNFSYAKFDEKSVLNFKKHPTTNAGFNIVDSSPVNRPSQAK